MAEGWVGGGRADADGTRRTDGGRGASQAARAVRVGAVGGPRWDGQTPRDRRPEAGLLNLRAGMKVYANLRPALCFPALADASSLKRHLA